MIRTAVRGLLAVSILACTLAPSWALGPVDVEVGAFYWLSSTESDGGTIGFDSDSGAVGFRGELWVKKFGLRAAVYGTDIDDLSGESADSTSIDLLWRPFSLTDKSYFAVGAGWMDIDLETIGMAGDTSGLRVAAEGSVGLVGIMSFYGQAAYYPDLDDSQATPAAAGRFEDLSGREVELGLSWKTAPFLSFRAAYRTQKVEFTRTGFSPIPGITELDGEVETDGFLAGLTFRF